MKDAGKTAVYFLDKEGEISDGLSNGVAVAMTGDLWSEHEWGVEGIRYKLCVFPSKSKLEGVSKYKMRRKPDERFKPYRDWYDEDSGFYNNNMFCMFYVKDSHVTPVVKQSLINRLKKDIEKHAHAAWDENSMQIIFKKSRIGHHAYDKIKKAYDNQTLYVYFGEMPGDFVNGLYLMNQEFVDWCEPFRKMIEQQDINRVKKRKIDLSLRLLWLRARLYLKGYRFKKWVSQWDDYRDEYNVRLDGERKKKDGDLIAVSSRYNLLELKELLKCD